MENDLDKDLERLRFLTRNYELLQGYPIALAGLLCLVWGASLMIWGFPARVLIHGWLFLPSVTFLVAGAIIASRFQRRKYGSVKPAPTISDRRTLA